jgi:nitrous oxidase accessory protein NosD
MGSSVISRKGYLTFLLLLGLLSLSLASPAWSQVTRTTIFIQPDGSVNPPNVSIQRNGDTYTFTGNVYDPILVQKSNITIDGAGYSLIGPLNETQKQAQQVLGIGPNATVTIPYIIGIDFDETVSGVTIKNLNLNWFSIGVYLRTTENTLVNNALVNNIVGVLLSGSANNITMNYIEGNRQGLFFGFEQVNGSAGNIPIDIRINENSFVANEMQLSGCVCEVYNFSEARHAWDYNNRGNYWSDYNGTDTNGDGIGDTYYVIDLLNYDRFPLIKSPAQPPTPPAQFPIEWIGLAIAAIVVVMIVFLVVRQRRKK